MVGTTTGWKAGQPVGRHQDQSPTRPRPGSNARPGSHEWVEDRLGDPDRRGGTGMEMEKVSRIMTSGIAVWLAILAGMSVFM